MSLVFKRIGGVRMLDPTRAEFDDSASVDDFGELAKEPRLKVLQCSQPVPDSVWIRVNECFFAARPDVLLRVYGHYTIVCDLAFVRLLTNARRLAADCLMKARGVEAISEMAGLESLSLGIFELKDFSVLGRISPTLTSLSLGATRSKKPSLASLNRFHSLRVLHIEGHSKDIDVVSELSGLEDLTLRSITTPDLSYLAPLPNLAFLAIKLGGIRDFTGIAGNRNIKHFELWQVRELPDIDIVAALPGLQNLFVQSLPNVRSFPPLKKSTALRRVVIENLKGLDDFTVFKTAPALDDFAMFQGNKQDPEQLLPVLNNPHVRRVIAYFGSKRKNSEFSRLREMYGKVEWDRWEPFKYH